MISAWPYQLTTARLGPKALQLCRKNKGKLVAYTPFRLTKVPTPTLFRNKCPESYRSNTESACQQLQYPHLPLVLVLVLVLMWATSESRTPRTFSPLIIYHPQWLNYLLISCPATKQKLSLLSQLLIGGKFQV